MSAASGRRISAIPYQTGEIRNRNARERSSRTPGASVDRGGHRERYGGEGGGAEQEERRDRHVDGDDAEALGSHERQRERDPHEQVGRDQEGGHWMTLDDVHDGVPSELS
jgi:hypothetical protein